MTELETAMVILDGLERSAVPTTLLADAGISWFELNSQLRLLRSTGLVVWVGNEAGGRYELTERGLDVLQVYEGLVKRVKEQIPRVRE